MPRRHAEDVVGMMRQYHLIEKVRSYDPNVDEEALNKAYVFSMQAHGTQQRASGDPYFSHPLQVAGILSEKKLDTASIVTGLLHDTVEDTKATLEDIEKNSIDPYASIRSLYRQRRNDRIRNGAEGSNPPVSELERDFEMADPDTKD